MRRKISRVRRVCARDVTTTIRASRDRHVQRAIVAKDAELKEIYEIQRSASTLTALIDAHERERAGTRDQP